jgi:hypothetical protein
MDSSCKNKNNKNKKETMKTKKKINAESKPVRFIEVFKSVTGRKDGLTVKVWNWHVTHRNKKKGNILYSATGFNSKAIAMKRAKAHNAMLKNELMIFDLSKAPMI